MVGKVVTHTAESNGHWISAPTKLFLSDTCMEIDLGSDIASTVAYHQQFGHYDVNIIIIINILTVSAQFTQILLQMTIT